MAAVADDAVMQNRETTSQRRTAVEQAPGDTMRMINALLSVCAAVCTLALIAGSLIR